MTGLPINSFTPIAKELLKPLPKGVSKATQDTYNALETQRAQMEAEAKRRDQGNEPVYALIKRNGEVVGSIYKDGLGEYFGNDLEGFWGRSETAEQIANRVKQSKIDGLTVEVFKEGTDAPTRHQANLMICNTESRIQKSINLIPGQPEKEDRPKTLAEGLRYFKEQMSAQTVAQSPAALATDPVEARWERNMNWFKTDQSA